MPKIKLPKNMLANKHLLIRQRGIRSIFAIAKKENKSIADLQEQMINDYLRKNYSNGYNEYFYNDYVIKDK